METIASILNQHGFSQIADIRYRLACQLWWHEQNRFHVQVLTLGVPFLVKAAKSYQMVGISEKGETRARDLNNLHQWLETRMPEYHISASGFRDVPLSMLRQNLIDLDPIKSQIESLQTEYNKAAIFAERVKSNKRVYQKFQTQKKHEIENLRQQGQQAALQNQKNERLSQELARKGHATSYLFTVSSNLLSGSGVSDFQDTLSMVCKEIMDIHKYQITQILEGGRFQIFINEVNHPDLAFQVEYAGGVLIPNQLGDEFSELRSLVEESLMVHPSENISEGPEKKLMGAKILQNFLLKLDRMEAPTDIPKLPQEGGWIGNLMLDNKITNIPVFLPVRQDHSAYEGGTGTGKTYAARIYTENMLLERTNLLVLDRTFQWAGLGLPNKHERVFDRYDMLGIETSKARGFKIKLHTAPIHEPSELTTGANIVSFKGVTKKEQCKQTAKILKHIYTEFVENGEDTTRIRLLIVLEETKTFLKDKFVREILDELCREGRKYGIIFLFCTQLPSDFKYDTKSIRTNVKNYIYLQLQDGNELSYVKDILGNSVDLVKDLKPGEAILKTPDLNVVKVFMRPPFSHVGEPSEDELREIKGNTDMEIIGYSTAPDVNDIEGRILDFLKETYQFSSGPVLASHIQEVLELSNSTCNRVLNKMAEKRLVKKEMIPGKTKPLLGIKIIPCMG